MDGFPFMSGVYILARCILHYVIIQRIWKRIFFVLFFFGDTKGAKEFCVFYEG